MHSIPQGVWPWYYSTEVNTEVLGQKEGGTKGRELFWEAVPHGERSYKEGTVLHGDIQHRSRRSGKGVYTGSM